MLEDNALGVCRSAARKADTKVANILLKVAQKVGNLKILFKTSLKQVLSRFKQIHFRIYIRAGFKTI